MGVFNQDTVLDEMKKEHEESRSLIEQIKEASGHKKRRAF